MKQVLIVFETKSCFEIDRILVEGQDFPATNHVKRRLLDKILDKIILVSSGESVSVMSGCVENHEVQLQGQRI